MDPVARLGAPPAEWYAAASAARPLELERGLLRRGLFATNDPASARTILTVLDLG